MDVVYSFLHLMLSSFFKGGWNETNSHLRLVNVTFMDEEEFIFNLFPLYHRNNSTWKDADTVTIRPFVVLCNAFMTEFATGESAITLMGNFRGWYELNHGLIEEIKAKFKEAVEYNQNLMRDYTIPSNCVIFNGNKSILLQRGLYE